MEITQVELDSRHSRDRRILREIELLKEAFSNVDVLYEKLEQGFQVNIYAENLKCNLNFPVGWPFYPPEIDITYKGQSWKSTVPKWSGAMDLRTIYMGILDDLQNSITANVCDQIDNLREIFSEIFAEYNRPLDRITIKHEGLCMTIDIIRSEKRIHVDVSENNRDWPENMVPIRTSLQLDFTDLVMEVVDARNIYKSKNTPDYIKQVHSAILTRYPNTIYHYHQHHQTFTIDHPEGLVILGVDPEFQYLPPDIAIFRKGLMIRENFPMNNWKFTTNLGEFLAQTEKFISPENFTTAIPST